MKLRIIAIAAASVAASFSASAAGISTAETNALKATMTAGRYVSVAGASAVQAGFAQMIAGILNNPVWYVDSGSLTSASYIAVSGTLKNTTTSAFPGQQVVLHYRVAGGSYNGVYPVARNIAIDALDVTKCSTTVGLGTSASPYVCSTRGPNSGATAANGLNAVGLAPDAGISDVEPSFFTVNANLEGETLPVPLSSAEVADITATPVYVQGFGIPLTRNLTGTTITKPIYSALMTGAFTNWNQVPGSTDSGPIVICRRIAGSGTQAVTNLFAGNVGCTGAAVTPVPRETGGAFVAGVGSAAGTYVASRAVDTTTNSGLIVIENNSSGDVRKCMDAAYFGGSYTTKDRSSNKSLSVDFGTGGYKAIGVLSLDSLSKSTNVVTTSATPTLGDANGFWQFRALGGTGTYVGDFGVDTTTGKRIAVTASNAATVVAPVGSGTGTMPTLANIQIGEWPMQGYESWNVPSRTQGDKLVVVNQIATAAQNANVLRSNAALAWASLSLPDFVTGNTTDAADASNVVQAASAGNSLCGPLQRQY